LPGMVAGDFIAVARSDELEERKAALPARKGSNAVAGFAVQILAADKGRARATATDLAEPSRPQSVLSKTCSRQTEREGVQGREWRVQVWCGGRGRRIW
jgi:hypothetical protein